jgi:hypothetical protein
MFFKTTKRLFKGQYQYKLVLTCAGASWFRGGDWSGVLENLKKIDLTNKNPWRRDSIKTEQDLDYAFKLQSQLKKLTDIDIMVQTPWITIYTNTKSNIDAIVKLDKDKVKYVSVPPTTPLAENTIILPKINHDYRVTLGKTTQEHSAFIEWAEKSTKLKLTKTCKRELSRDSSWGGTYFYITGDNNLLLAKMHLGGSINKVERIIKA